MTRDLAVIGDLFGTPVGTDDQLQDQDDPELSARTEAGALLGSSEAEDRISPPSAPPPLSTDRPEGHPLAAGSDRPASLSSPAADCVLGLRRGSGPKRRMTIGLPVGVAMQLRDGMDRFRRHRSLTDFVLAAVGALGDAGDPPAEDDWPPGRFQTALFLAQSERQELEARAAARGISVSALVAISLEPYLEALTV